MHIYNIILTFSGTDQEPILRRRSWESLEVLSQGLQALHPALAETALLGELVRVSSVPPTAVALERALQLCISNTDVVHSQCLSQFLWDQEDDAGRSPEPGREVQTAFDFILQPVEMAAQYIPCRQLWAKDFFLQRGETILWRFTVGGGYDILFSALYRSIGDNVDSAQDINAFAVVESVSKERLDAAVGIGSPKTAAADPVGGESDVITTAAPRRVESPAAADGSIAFSQGSYSPQRAGFARLVFDNRYSRINGKHISFAVQVVGQDVIQAAVQAAEDVEQTMQRSYSSAYRRILGSTGEVRVSVDGPWRDPNVRAPTDEDMLHLSPTAGNRANSCDEDLQAAVQRLPLSADAEVGLVQRYVESGADHRRVVASGRQTQWTGGDIVLDDAFESASPKSDLTPAAARPGGWLGATIGAIAQVYAAPATALPSPSDSSDVKTLASLPSVPLQGYYYPINSALLYDASAALLRLVWKGHHGRVDDASHPPAASSSAGQMADLLKIAEHVDELEDRNAILTAERDQARAIGIRDALALKMAREDVVSVEAMLSLQERHTQVWRDRANALEKDTITLRQALSDSHSQTEELHAALAAADERKKQAESTMLDNSVWESTREGVHRQLSEAATKADMERRRADESARRCQDLEAQSDSLTQRIIELEQALAAGTVHRGSSVSGVDTDRDIREYASRVQELQSRLQVAECQTRIDISTMRQQLRRNSAMLALAKTEAAECRMMADAYKEKLSTLKVQKKALVSELRGLRDLGLYEGRITVDHARPAAPHISTKHIERISSLDMSISLDDATNALGRERPATSIDPAKRAVKGITDSDENNRPKEKGINFCVLKLTTEPAVVNSADEEVIDFMSDQPAPSPAVQAAPQRDVETAAALRHARLRQQTVSLILQDDPANGALRELFEQLSADVGSLQGRLDTVEDDEDFDLPPHDTWMSTVLS